MSYTYEQTSVVMLGFWKKNVDLPIGHPDGIETAAAAARKLWPSDDEATLRRKVEEVLQQERIAMQKFRMWSRIMLNHALAARIAIEEARKICKKDQFDQTDPDLIWMYLETALIRAAALSRCIFPNPIGSKTVRAAHIERGKLLQERLGADDNYLRRVREMRNDIEHFDERIDEVVAQHPGPVGDYFILRRGPTPLPNALLVRSYDPKTDELTVFGRRINLEKLAELCFDLMGVVASSSSHFYYSVQRIGVRGEGLD